MTYDEIIGRTSWCETDAERQLDQFCRDCHLFKPLGEETAILLATRNLVHVAFVRAGMTALATIYKSRRIRPKTTAERKAEEEAWERTENLLSDAIEFLCETEPLPDERPGQ